MPGIPTCMPGMPTCMPGIPTCMPGAPGARPGGIDVTEFFWAVRRIAGDHRVRVIDLTEWDPSLDSTDLSALTAARWLAECVAGFEDRS